MSFEKLSSINVNDRVKKKGWSKLFVVDLGVA